MNWSKILSLQVEVWKKMGDKGVVMKGEVMMHAPLCCVVHIIGQCREHFTKLQNPAVQFSGGCWHQGHPWPVSAPPLLLPMLLQRLGGTLTHNALLACTLCLSRCP